jgi:hypothetical protein
MSFIYYLDFSKNNLYRYFSVIFLNKDIHYNNLFKVKLVLYNDNDNDNYERNLSFTQK